MHTSFSAGVHEVNPWNRCNPACTERGIGVVHEQATLHLTRYTLGLMDAKPASSSEHTPGGQEDGSERFGPLAVRRLRKDDGRQLIAYERTEADTEPGAGPGPEAAPSAP